MRSRSLAWVASGLAALAAVLGSRPAAAFHPLETFRRSINQAGGGEIYFTGSPRFRGYDCTICHVGAPGAIRLALTSDPPELFAAQIYRPWQLYELTVRLEGEHRGIGDESAQNGFVAELLDDGARPAGVFGEATVGNLQRVDGEVLVDGVVAGATKKNEWAFTWQAPGPGVGRLALHLAAVDGDGASTQASPPPTDPFGDDVAVERLRFCELWTSCDVAFEPPAAADDRESPAGYGCSVARPPSESAPADLFWLAVLAGGRARRARLRARA
jgi:hypothetical protein